ncbi:hypothetical protein GG851_15500 [Bordetella petrii]|nr:hypothetical protein [Bordetella petrii]
MDRASAIFGAVLRLGQEPLFQIVRLVDADDVRGAAGEAQFSTEAVRDPAVVALRERVHAVVDPAMRKLEGRVRIVLRDGEVLERHVPEALGTLAHPMSDADLEEKFRGLVQSILPDGQAGSLIQACWNLPKLDDAGMIARLAAAGPSLGA